ncbi:MAG: hypothetical protein PHS95_00900 [Candidatus Pacebacteria bacterium]|nr:hypothetical protein [Candidatus Paceibacterota bacterium]
MQTQILAWLFKDRGIVVKWFSALTTTLSKMFDLVATTFSKVSELAWWALALALVVLTGVATFSLYVGAAVVGILLIVLVATAKSGLGMIQTLGGAISNAGHNSDFASADDISSDDEEVPLEDNADANDDEIDDEPNDGMRRAAERGALAAGFRSRRISR